MRLFGRFPRFLSLLVPLLIIGLIAAACGDNPDLVTFAGDSQDTFDPQSDFTDRVHTIYIFVTVLAAIVFVAVLGATLFISIWFRERPGRVAKQFHGNTRLEIIWTIIPAIILIAISIPTWNAIIDSAKDPPADALQVEVIGHQWWFEFRYPELGIVTANELHLPVGRAVTFSMESVDVIHSFWIPQLVGKRDIVPGHRTELWFTPTRAQEAPYLGQCAEFCGLSHALMRFRVFVDTPEDFQAWVENEQSDGAEPATVQAQEGQQIFSTTCGACHTIAGTAAAGVIGPNLSHVGSRQTIAAGTLANNAEELKRWISDPSKVKPGAEPPRSMPAFAGLLTDDQLDAIVAYLQGLE